MRTPGRATDVVASRVAPWKAPRRELLLLVLVGGGGSDAARGRHAAGSVPSCLTEALLHGHVSNDACLSSSFDKASYHGHLYSDKAPGLSLLVAVPVALLHPGPPARWSSDDLRLWGVRLLTVGAAFLLCGFMVGRVSEGLAPGFGGIALVAFALGTLVAPFAAVSYAHVPAAALAFAAFLLSRGAAGPALPASWPASGSSSSTSAASCCW